MKELDIYTINLLRKESYLASMNLWVWLTFMRKYDFSQLWFFYQWMFSLSIWIERLMKLILIYEELTTNKPQINPKKAWHDLLLLYEEIKKLATNYGTLEYFNKNANEKIPLLILVQLNKFANNGWRYFHIDSLKWTQINSTDPLIEWDIEVNSKILQRHKKIDDDYETLEAVELLNSWMTVRAFSTEWKIITNYKELYNNEIKDLEVKQKYSTYYVFCIIKALCELQKRQSWDNRTNIELSEFFTVFRRSYTDAKKYKSWNPNPPFKF